MLELIIVALLVILAGVGYAYYRLREETDELIKSSLTTQREIDQKQVQIDSLQTRLSESQDKIAGLEQQSAQHREQIATLQTQHHEQVEVLQTQSQAQIDSLQTQHTAQVEALQAELNTARSEHAYQFALARTLANSAYDVLMVTDEQSQVLSANHSARQLFAIDTSASKRLGDFTGGQSLEMMVDNALINAEETLEEQINIGDRAFRARVEVMKHQNHTLIGIALQDISQLIRLARARRDMVANISHELRTPIANIRLIIDGLFHEQDKPKRKESISSLHAIARETDALLWLVQEMADLAMIESGQAIVRMVEVPLLEVIVEAVERLVDQFAAKNLSVVRHIPPRIIVLCDRDLIQRVIVNLLHNAMKWSPNGEAVTLSAVDDGEEVTISVFDNGPGVPEDQVDRIFERFYQVDASRSGSDGTGLGLSICRHIVEAHGGRVWAESNRGGSGGRFRFTLLSAGTSEAEHIIGEADGDA